MKKLFGSLLVLLLAIPGVRGQTWSQTGIQYSDWFSVAMSADGSKLAAAYLDGISIRSTGSIYVSTDYGTNWAPTEAPDTNWYSLAESADGSILGGITSGDTLNGPMFRSVDAGNTWSQTTAPATNWFNLAMSADGSKWVACCGGFTGIPGSLFFSTDSGVSWQPANAPVLGWMCARCSADGVRWIGVPWRNQVYMSTNSGADWSVVPGLPSASWQAVASSADGTRLAAADYGGFIYTSSDSGGTWAPSSDAGTNNWVDVVSSADGSVIFAPINFGLLYTSEDFGATWTASGSTNDWQQGACSADGGRLAVCSLFSYVFTGQTSRGPQLNLNLNDKSAMLDFIVPSQSYQLVESANLAATKWAVVTNAVTFNASSLHNEVTVSATNAQEFFRLQFP